MHTDSSTSNRQGTPPPRPAKVWETGLVACYHPIPKRIDMGMGWEKCGVCLYFRKAEEADYWPPVSAP